MDDALYGTRDKRGDWKPREPIQYPPVFVWPVRPLLLARWLLGWPGYILPWNLIYLAVAALLWFALTPPLATMRSFEIGWVAWLLGRNAAILLLFFGFFHLLLFVRRSQGTAFKFNGRWPATDGSAFLFRNQTADNMIWSLASGLPLWTAWEAATLWAFANGHIAFLDFAAHPVYAAALLLMVPVWRDIHFYGVHRLLHWPPLYRAVHSLHHNNANPGPWSGLAMHPVEHLLYFSCVLIHWVVPSHPLHALFNLTHAALAPAPGHLGFERLAIGRDRAIATHCWAHYLHHKHFECNYADGVIPFDKWFGTFHDGSREAEAAMNERFMARSRRQAAKAKAA